MQSCLRFVFIFSFLYLIGLADANSAQMRIATNKDQAILIEAEATTGNPPFITLKWKKNELALNYRIQRKEIGDDGWGGDIAKVDSSQSSYEDKTAEIGKIYEYKIYAQSYGQFHETINGKDSVIVEQFYAYGYVSAGMIAQPPRDFGKVLLIVDETLAPSLQTELETLKTDLVLDGWSVVMKTTKRAETFDSGAVKATKQIILDEYANDPDNLRTVFLIGRVPVPYSGNFNPDAHPDHKGAWPADLYYGSMNEDYWSDVAVNNTTAGRAENKNVPGDGKFDQTAIPGVVDLQVGRVDFFNLIDFKKTELELLKNYFDKDHKFRIGITTAQTKCIVDDNFGGYVEGFATSGWRIASLVGKDNIVADDFFTSLETNPTLWAYGCGGGTYTSAGGVGSSADFISKSPKAIFTMLFGSYFGDWDAQNAFMRSCIASSPSILTCSWAGRPQWFYHHMGMGLPIGYSAITTQNNTTMYQSNYLYPLGYPNGVIYTIGIQQVHQALLGDPTLRMYMNDPTVPKNFTVYQPAGKKVQLNWDMIQDDILGYNIYKSTNGYEGPFTKVNKTVIPQTTNTYTDPELFEGNVIYVLRTEKITKSKSGTFINQSRGIMQNLATTGVDNIGTELNLTCKPNPAVTMTNVSLSLGSDTYTRITIIDVNGNTVKSLINEVLSAGTHEFMWDLSRSDGQKVAEGVYFVKLETEATSKVLKMIVMP